MSSEEWNMMSKESRTKVLENSDPTMKHKRWARLIDEMSGSNFEELSSLQKDVVKDL